MTFQVRIKKLLLGAGIAVVLLGSAAFAQSVPVVTGDARVDKLLSQMTLEEKLKLIDGTQEDSAVYHRTLL